MHMEICAVVDESLIMVRDFAMLVVFDLLLPFGIPPSELSDTINPIMARSIGLIESNLDQVPVAYDARWWKI